VRRNKRRFTNSEITEEENVNLVPIMNLFVALIPFLLMSAAFFNISVINASVPALGQGKSELGRTEEKVTIMAQIMSDGFKINATSDSLSRAKLDELRAEIPRKESDLDFQGLSKYLMSCKQQYPKSDTVILVPDAMINYQDVIQTMDASRHIEEKSDSGEKINYELFPTVVISGMM